MTDPTTPKPRRSVWIMVVLAVLIALAMLCLFGYLWDSNHGEGVIIGATIGTALGTLALAGTTYALARATRQTVRETEAELAELKEQGKLVAEQARIAGEQATATARLADASASAAVAAEKARVDAISPLVLCSVDLAFVQAYNASRQAIANAAEQTWDRAALNGIEYWVTLKFTIKNVGNAPARVAFGDTSTFLERVRKEVIDAVTLQSGEPYIDSYRIPFRGDELTDGKFVKMPFTYTGVMHGEMFDRIQWNGWVTPLFDESPGSPIRPHPRLVNSAGAQVIREYPNLERPDEMAEARRRLLE